MPAFPFLLASRGLSFSTPATVSGRPPAVGRSAPRDRVKRAVRRAGGLVLAAALIGSLSACSAVDGVRRRVETINRDIGDTRNQALLLNIARASYGHPLNFVAVANLGGSNGMNANFGLPTITFGPEQSITQRQFVFGGNGVGGSTSGNFSASPLDSREFYEGLLQPLTLQSAQFFLRQGFPREIVFYLFIDELTVRSGGTITHVRNDPFSPAFPRFADYIRRAIDYGLTLETTSGPAPAVRLCFDPGLARLPLGALGPVCGDGGPATGLRNFVEGSYGAVDVSLSVRSTYQIFQYLGRLAEPGSKPRVTVVGSDIADRGRDPELFPVLRSVTAGRCLTSVFYAGDYFCVPFAGNRSGARVLDLLSLLVALSSSVRNLPTVQTLQVTQ